MFWDKITMSATPWKVILVHTMTLNENLCSRFVDYIGHLGQSLNHFLPEKSIERQFSRLNRFLIQWTNEFLLWIWSALNVWTRIFLFVFKDKPSCITLPTAVIEQPSLAILFADVRFLFKHTFRLILAISYFVLTVLTILTWSLTSYSSRFFQIVILSYFIG